MCLYLFCCIFIQVYFFTFLYLTELLPCIFFYFIERFCFAILYWAGFTLTLCKKSEKASSDTAGDDLQWVLSRENILGEGAAWWEGTGSRTLDANSLAIINYYYCCYFFLSEQINKLKLCTTYVVQYLEMFRATEFWGCKPQSNLLRSLI